MSDDPAAAKLETALSMVEASFPNAVSVLAAMDVLLDDRVETACVTPSGRMLVSRLPKQQSPSARSARRTCSAAAVTNQLRSASYALRLSSSLSLHSRMRSALRIRSRASVQLPA